MGIFKPLLVAAALAVPAVAVAQQQTEVLWLGQSAFRIATPGGKVIVIDPYLTKNPKTPSEYKDLSKLGKVDVILVTHGHGDHLGDAVELAKANNAKIVGNVELPRQLVAHGLLAAELAVAMNKGGTVTPVGEGVQITMVPADHSSGMQLPDPDSKKEHLVYGGEPVGFVIEMENGFKIYHAGDTGVFGDMALIHARYAPDLALLPIGGHFTMGPEDAAYAIKMLLKPKKVIPMHYGTFPALKGTPEELKKALGEDAAAVVDLQPGQAVRF
jgi:L-ascorbate metabolism protein UlaG (beta-lactamase superfamily)